MRRSFIEEKISFQSHMDTPERILFAKRHGYLTHTLLALHLRGLVSDASQSCPTFHYKSQTRNPKQRKMFNTSQGGYCFGMMATFPLSLKKPAFYSHDLILFVLNANQIRTLFALLRI